jgi:MYXO-CTERM domain-containing protein
VKRALALVGATVVSLAVAAPTAQASEASPPTTVDVEITIDREEVDTPDTDTDDDSDKTGLWGLLGLIGLAGLAGLAKRRNDSSGYRSTTGVQADTTPRGSGTHNP